MSEEKIPQLRYFFSDFNNYRQYHGSSLGFIIQELPDLVAG